MSALADALAANAPVETVLELADTAIESTRDAAVLAALGDRLVIASARRPDDVGLQIAARRAHGLAGITARETPEVTVAPPPPAAVPTLHHIGFWHRLGAFLIDWTVVFGALWALGVTEAGAVIWLIVPAYFTIVPLATGGRTLGKAAVGITVRRVDGEEADFVAHLGRTLVYLLLLVTFVGAMADALVTGLDRRKRSLHDRAAGTVVVAHR